MEVEKGQNDFTYKKTIRMPDAGIKSQTLYEKSKKLLELDRKKGNFGKISGCYYFEQNDLNKEIIEFSKQYLYHNLLHWDLDVSIRQIEGELVALTSELFGGDVKNPYGVVTQGGSESICMAVLSARNYCAKNKGITKPELIASTSVHFSFDKACSMFNIKFNKIDVDPKTFQIDLKKMKKAINKNTILIVGSCPNYPHGIIDPLEEIAAIAKQKNILFHVDCCLGSLNLPFAIELGQPLPKFDFRLDGVTSISTDHHKHGLAPKGVSVVLYKRAELRHAQYFVSLEWPGGAYGLPTIPGSRSGAPAAGAWYAMMNLGKAGFRKNAERIFKTLNYLKQEINAMPELELFGNPIVNTIAFRSKNEKQLNSYCIKQALLEKGWTLTGIQRPAGIHISITQSFVKSVESFISDLKVSITEVQSDPTKFDKSIEAEMYGSTMSLPMNSIQGFTDMINAVVDITLKP